MSYIRTYESLFGNKYYFTSATNIHDTDLSISRANGIQLNYIFSDKPIFIYPVYHKSNNFLKLNIKSLSSYSNNYIYKVSDNLKLFRFDKHNISKMLEMYPKTKENLFNYFNKSNELLRCILDYTDSKLDIIKRFDINELSDFILYYNGIFIDDMHVFVFEIIYLDSTLVDGMAVKFPNKGVDSDIVFPGFVVDELIRYTNMSNTKMKKDVKEWLKTNVKKSDVPITLYRGISIDTFPSYDDTILSDNNQLGNLLYQKIGIRNLNDIKKGSIIVSKRGKESSWTYRPQIAKSFISGLGKEDINILAKSIMNPIDIVVDFTMLPDGILNKIKYRYQNEVIVETGKYECIISEVYLSNKLKEKLGL